MLLKYTVLILKIILFLNVNVKYYRPFHGSYFPCTDDKQWIRNKMIYIYFQLSYCKIALICALYDASSGALHLTIAK